MVPDNFDEKIKYFQTYPNRWHGEASNDIYRMLDGYNQDLWERYYKGWTRGHLKEMILILDGEIDEGY
jgi:hypothetical protein